VIGNRAVSWEQDGDRIQFGIELHAGEAATVQLRYREQGDVIKATENLNDKARTMLRRYLCELRDNYLHRLTALSSNGNL
jgi:hypothetical protein